MATNYYSCTNILHHNISPNCMLTQPSVTVITAQLFTASSWIFMRCQCLPNSNSQQTGLIVSCHTCWKKCLIDFNIYQHIIVIFPAGWVMTLSTGKRLQRDLKSMLCQCQFNKSRLVATVKLAVICASSVGKAVFRLLFTEGVVRHCFMNSCCVMCSSMFNNAFCSGNPCLACVN